MQLIFKNFQTKETISSKEIDIGAHVPHLYEIVITPMGFPSNVVSVEYYLSTEIGELYKKIEVFLEVFKEKE